MRQVLTPRCFHLERVLSSRMQASRTQWLRLSQPPPSGYGPNLQSGGQSRAWEMAGDIKADRGFFVLLEDGGALKDDQSTLSGQSGLQWFEGINLYAALVMASVSGVRLLPVFGQGFDR